MKCKSTRSKVEENDALRARVARLEAGAAALRDATEDAMRQRATSTGEHALLTARLAAVEADARRARERNQALVRDAQLRAAELEDAAAALANEESWQRELQKRLDDTLATRDADEARHAASRKDLEFKVTRLFSDLEATRAALDARPRRKPKRGSFRRYHPGATCVSVDTLDMDYKLRIEGAPDVFDVEVIDHIDVDALDAAPGRIVSR